MRVLVLWFVALVLSAHLSGCSEEFNPHGVYEEKVVVFAILTTLSDTQYVRIYKTYDPPAFDPLAVTTDQAVTGAQVVIREGSTLYRFRDTTIVRVDRSRYRTDINAYVAYSFVVQPGKTYLLEIVLPDGRILQSALTVPPPAIMRNDNYLALQNPFLFSEEIDLKSFLSPLARGYVVRTFVEYEVFAHGAWRPRREEIPLAIRSQLDCTTFDAVYPPLLRRKPGQPELSLYLVSAYTSTLRKIWNSHPRSDVRLKQVAFELNQLDKNLYDYYSLVNGFRDEFSIRTDEPDYSSIPGALGIFGALTKQRLVVSIPDTLGRSLMCQ